MSTSTSQSGDVIIEVKTEEIGPEVKKDEPEIEDEDEDEDESDREYPNKYLAISPEGDFLVELVLKDFDFELQMYDIKISNDKDDFKQKSRRKLSKIQTTFKFTNGQINLSKDKDIHKNIFRWSVAVSDKSTNSSEFRLLAISYISLKDMKYYKENCDNIHPTQIYNHGFTFVFIINIINNVYSISDFKDKELPIKYGGVVKFISKKNDIINQNDEKDKQRTDKSSQNADRYTLIILTLSGIYKYQMKNKLIKNIQKLKYPRRVYNAMIRNITSFFNFPGDLMYNAYGNEHEDINLSLNKHYFLADTTNEDIKYIELYDLKTNHLVNTFQRQNLSGSYNVDVPSYYAISNNGKLLAYASLFNKAIKIFSIECGLEIAELITDIAFIDIQIDFFRSDEILCVFSKNKWIVWDIFGALLGSVKLIDNVLDLPSKFYENIERSNSFMVVNEGNELAIYDDLIINIYLKDLKKDEEQIWKKLSNDDFSRQDPNSNIRDLQDKESKLDEYYHILEPWLIHYDRRHSNYSVYLDEKKEKLLLIGNHTIQVWHDQGPKKRSLEFIHVPLSHLPFNYEQDFMEADKSETLYMIKVIDINYCIGKFKLNIQIENIEDKSFQIKMEDKNDIMNVVQYACHSLKYLSSYKKFEWLIEEDQKLKFTNIIEQTRKIILRFIRLHPSEWRLLDIRYDLMSVLIESKEYELVKYILSFKEPLHIPQYISWEGEKNTIHTALSDRTMLAYFLEYYSNKAVDNDNIGWMNTVVDIIPELCKINEKKSKKENHNIGWVNTVVDIISKLYKNNKIESDEEKAESYIYYAQKLFYHSCFYKKRLDLISFKFLEISPKANGLLKVLIPITQLIPQDCELNLQEIDYNKIVNIRMAPLANFTNNKKIFDKREKKFTDYLNLLIFPIQYSSLKEEGYSPFIKLIEKDFKQNKHDIRDILYENPSMGAVMNWMWYCSKFYWSRSLYIFVLYFLAYSVISWAYIAHIHITGVFQHFLLIITIVLFYYLSYYHIVIELNQFYHRGKQYYLDYFNIVDLLSLIIPIIIFSYILICYYTFDNGFKNAESSQILIFLIFLSILILWYEFFLLLRIFEGFAQNLDIMLNIIISIRQFLLFFFLAIIAMGHALFTLLGYPFYIGLKQSPTTYEITKGNNVAYTMTGEEPDNPFSNIIGSIVAVYDWSSISFDTWNFWPLTIISIIGSFVFVIILQNIIISYMSDAFANAVKDSKRGVYRFQIDFIYDFALLEKSLEFNNLDSKFKDKIRAKYICFYDDPNITSSWKEVSEKMESEPYTITQIENKINLEFLEFLSDEDCKFIWEKAENVEKVEKVENDDKDIQYWFLE